MSDGGARLARLRQVPLFAELSEDDLVRVCSDATDVRLAPGEVLFHEGDRADRAFLVASGEVEVLKATGSREALLAVRSEGEVIGEMALLEAAPRSATVRARTATELVSIPRDALDDLLTTSPSAARTVFGLLTRRVRETNDRLRHQQRMVQLGVMTAGVAHELNNPAAAVQSAAGQLTSHVSRLVSTAGHDSADALLRLLGVLDERAPRTLDALERSDEEDRVGEWLGRHGVAAAGQLAPDLVAAGIGVEDLRVLGEDEDLGGAVRFLAAAASLRQLAGQVVTGSRRLSEIVGALRSFAYLDRGPVQEVDVVRGLEDTVALLGKATSGVRIVRELAPDLPAVAGTGGELNQVWTNLVQNACEALAGTPRPSLTLRAFEEGDGVVVEVEDNGPGIRPSCRSASSTRSSRPSPRARGRGSGCRSATASSSSSTRAT